MPGETPQCRLKCVNDIGINASGAITWHERKRSDHPPLTRAERSPGMNASEAITRHLRERSDHLALTQAKRSPAIYASEAITRH